MQKGNKVVQPTKWYIHIMRRREKERKKEKKTNNSIA
jgi:hypothetical protein